MVLSPEVYKQISPTLGRLDQIDKLVFQHFPRTGGTTVHNCFAALFQPHEICPERFDRFAFWPLKELQSYRFFSAHVATRGIQYIPGFVKVFSFFRDPVDRCISLYDYWSSLRLDGQDESRLLEPRFARSYSPRDFFALTNPEQRRPFWNVYAAGLAGDALLSPEGRLWRSDSELLDVALARLEQLSFVGISEDMARSMDALCRQLDLPNLYTGQFDNSMQKKHASDDGGDKDVSMHVSDECLDLIIRANELDRVIYDRALALRLDGEPIVRDITCVPGPMPACWVRRGFADSRVENREGGYILFGPYIRLLPGTYAVAFHLRKQPTDGWSETSLGRVDVVASKGCHELAHRQLPSGFEGSSEMIQELTFEVTHVVTDIEFRVFAEPGAPFDVDLAVRLSYGKGVKPVVQ